MRHTISLLIPLMAGFAAADYSNSPLVGNMTTTSSAATHSASSTDLCAGQLNFLVEICLSREMGQQHFCTSDTDWDCLCTTQANINSCYDNCPSHADAAGAKKLLTRYCDAAQVERASSMSVASAMSATKSASAAHGSGHPAHSSTTTAPSKTTDIESTSSYSSAAEAAASSLRGANAAMLAAANSATDTRSPAGGLLAAMFGLIALL